MDTHQEKNKIEYFKGEFLHPSLDVKNNVLILGFRFISKDLSEENIFVVATKENILLYQEKNLDDLQKKGYFIEPKKRLLARVEEKWDLEDLINFIDDYNSTKSKIPPAKKVFKNTKNLLKKYVELEIEEDYSLISAWIIGTYFFPIFSACLFLHIKAPKRSGKSQCLNFLNQLCFNAVKARPSLAALSSTVDSLRGTYLIDQADALKRRGSEELLDILADSYKKSGGKRRIINIDKRNGREILEFESYSPKAFASIGELPEDLADRCVIIPLIKSQKNFPDPSEEESKYWKEIRGWLYKTLINNFSIIKNTYEILRVEYRNNLKMMGRDLELWLPLETVLKYCVEEIELNQIKERFIQLYHYTEYEPSELEKTTIETVYQLFGDDEKKKIIRPAEIREKITNEIVWEDYFSTNPNKNPPTKHRKDIAIGYAIKKFNLSSDKKKTSEGIAYVFEKEKVLRIRNIYCQNTENTANSSLLEKGPENLTENSTKINEELENPNTSP